MKYKNKLLVSLIALGIVGGSEIVVYGQETDVPKTDVTHRESLNLMPNFRGDLSDYKHKKFESLVPFTEQRGDANAVFNYISNSTKTIAYLFSDSKDPYSFIEQNEFMNQSTDSNCDPNNDNYYWQGSYGQWTRRGVPSGGRIIAISTNAGFFEGEPFDIKVTIDFAENSGDQNWAILSGRDFLTAPSKNSTVKIEIFEHNSKLNLENVKSLKLRDEVSIANVLKNSKRKKISGCLNFYDFDNPQKKITIAGKYVDKVQYSKSQKKDKQNLGLVVQDNVIEISGENNGSKDSNNLNHLVSFQYNNQSELVFNMQTYYYDATVGTTGISFKLIPLIPGYVEHTDSKVYINQYVPYPACEFDSDLKPKDVYNLHERFMNNIYIPKNKLIQLIPVTPDGFSFVIDSENENDRVKFIHDNSQLNSYGKSANLVVNLKSVIPKDLSKADSETVKDLMKYLNFKSGKLEIPYRATFELEKATDGTIDVTELGSGKIEVSVDESIIHQLMIDDKKKESAKADIDAKAEKVKGEIDADSTLTAEEKGKQKAGVDQEAEKAKKAIDGATAIDEVNQAKADGIKAIDNQHKSGDPVDSRKEPAKADIDAEAEKVKGEIDADSTLTAEEKGKQKAGVDQEAEKVDIEISRKKGSDSRRGSGYFSRKKMPNTGEKTSYGMVTLGFLAMLGSIGCMLNNRKRRG